MTDNRPTWQAGVVSFTESERVGHTTHVIGHGVKVVAVAGTDLCLVTESVPAKWISVQAQTDNVGLIAVGTSGVDATIATGTGVLLAAGVAITFPIDDLSDVFIDATVSGEGVRYLYGA